MQNQIIYSIPVTEKRKGETAVYRNPQAKFGWRKPLFNNMKSFWNHTAKKYSVNKCLEDNTYAQIDQMSCYIGSWLTKNQNKVLYIHSKNRWEWTLIDIACFRYGIISVPLYDTLGKQAIEHTFRLTEGHTIVSTQETLNSLLSANVTNLNNIKTIILLEETKPQILKKLHQLKIKTIKLQEILNQKNILKQPEIAPQHHFTYCFTSGTTGLPKGAIITHWNMVSQIYGTKQILSFRQTDVHFSFLPLPHMFQRYMEYTVILQGAQLRYYGGNTQQITKDLNRVKPTVMPIVPRLLNLFYSALSPFSHVDKKLAQQAWKIKKQNWQKGILTSPYDDTVFKPARLLFGGRLRFMVTGSAPVSVQVLNFFRIVLGCDIRQGYGQTQTVAASFVTSMHDKNAGHVGGPNPSFQFKLVDIPEMNYSSQNNPPTGEICLKGYSIFTGYFKDVTNTKQAIDEQGWHHTGDVGVIQANGALRIIDRKKNIYKLSQGEYIAPQKIQNIYLRCPLVAQVFLYGDSLQNFNVAIIVPQKDAVQKFAKQKGITGNFEVLCKNQLITEFIFKSATEVAKKQGLKGFELAKKIRLHHNSFVSYGLFTSTLKMQRFVAKKVFEKEIKQLYSTN